MSRGERSLIYMTPLLYFVDHHDHLNLGTSRLVRGNCTSDGSNFWTFRIIHSPFIFWKTSSNFGREYPGDRNIFLYASVII